MRFDHIYQDEILMMTVISGITLPDIMKIFNTRKRKVVTVRRILNKDGTSLWHVKTEIRQPTFLEKLLAFFRRNSQ